MSQEDIIERLYYVPDTGSVDLSIMLDITQQSVTSCLKRLKKHRYVTMNNKFKYKLTDRGEDFAKRYLL